MKRTCKTPTTAALPLKLTQRAFDAIISLINSHYKGGFYGRVDSQR